jgi:hypothetical protein
VPQQMGGGGERVIGGKEPFFYREGDGEDKQEGGGEGGEEEGLEGG